MQRLAKQNDIRPCLVCSQNGTRHGFRKWFKTQSEISGMKPINVEILIGHSVGLSDSYYRATEAELLEDYLKAIDFLTLSVEHQLEKEMSRDSSEQRTKDLPLEN